MSFGTDEAEKVETEIGRSGSNEETNPWPSRYDNISDEHAEDSNRSCPGKPRPPSTRRPGADENSPMASVTRDIVCKTDGESRTIQPFGSEFVEPLSSLKPPTESVADDPVDDSTE